MIRKALTILIVLLVLAAGGYLLYKTGVVKWQHITIFLAAIAAPFKMLFNSLKKKNEDIEAIKDHHRNIREMESAYQANLAKDIEVSEQKVKVLSRELDLINSRLALIEEKKKNVNADVDNMSIAETKAKARELFGD